MELQSLFVDSWGWITLGLRSEPAFGAVQSLYHRERGVHSRLVTTDFVFDEVITSLFTRIPSNLATRFLEGVFHSVDVGEVRLERISGERLEKAWKMRVKYSDHPKISFTDFTSFVVMREVGISRVLTNDHHFLEVNLGFEKVP